MLHLISHPANCEDRVFSNKFRIPFLKCMKFLFRLVFCGVTVLFFSGCAFNKLGKEVAILDQTSILQGTISNPSPHKKPLIVLAYKI